MSFDTKGTAPGLVQPPLAEVKTINMRCRVDGCDSIQAIDVTPSSNAPGHNTYQCFKCKRTWGISIGGGVNF
jgi:hypothetical protein